MGARAASFVLVLAAAMGVVTPPWASDRAVAAPPVEALLVGDSVMNGMAQGYGAAARAALAARHSYVLDTAGCRRLITTSCSIGGRPAPTNAITAVTANAGRYHGTLVVAVGYNDPPTGPVGIATAVDVIVAEARRQGIGDVVWLTYREAGPAATVSRFRSNNAVLRAKAAEIPELRLADWNAMSAGLPPSWFSADGIHLGAQAALAMADLVGDALDQAPTSRCNAPSPSGLADAAGSDVAADAGPGGEGGLHMLPAPVRLLDTRTWSGPLAAGGVARVAVAPVAPTPGASAALVSLVQVDACAAGYLTAYPCGSAPPNASVVNGGDGTTVANAALVPLGADGEVCVYASATTDVIVDLLGVVAPAGDGTVPLPPVRLVDTRPGAPARLAVPDQRVGPAGLTVDVRTLLAGGPLPAALAVNLTAAWPGGDGFLSLLPGPCTGQIPSTSTLNVRAHQDAAAGAVVGLVEGTFCVFSNVETDVIVDLHAAHGSTIGGGSIVPVVPTRVVDTRLDVAVAAGETRVLPGLVPAGRRGAIVNVTVADPQAPGYVSVHPCGTPPEVSNVNVGAAPATANLAVIDAGDAGDVCVFSSTTTDVIIDVEAWIS